MNLLVVNWLDRENPHAGGAEVHLFEIFTRLVERGHRVRLVCSGWAGAARRAMVQGIEVARIGSRNGFALLGRGAVRRALREETPDILIEDINKLPLFTSGMTDRPLYVIVPHLFGETIFREASLPVATLVWAAERPIPRCYRRATFQAISESTRDDLIERGVAPGRIRVIHPGVDSTGFTPGAGGRTSPPSFLYLGRLRRYKGVDVAIHALARARQARPDLILNIAGTGEDLARLRRLTRSLDQESAVRFLGFVSEERKLALLRETWANLLPSPKEGWGITVVEAAACGTPSLVSDSPGLRDSCRHGETGYLVPHGDATALAARMLELAADPALVERLGHQGRSFAEQLSWDRTARETEAHLESLLTGATRS